MNNQNLIIFNTIVLYGRMVFSAVVILLSTRIVLQELGASDYGIYNLMVGVISMLSFLNAAMSAATQRFLSYALGKGEGSKDVFYYSIILHLLIAVIVVVVIEMGGHLFLHYLLNIPIDRITTAHRIIDMLSVGMAFTIISVPYDGVFNARENMLVVSLIGCLESCLKLTAALIIMFVANIDKLFLYALLMCIVPAISFLTKKVYCNIKYAETKYKFKRITDFSLFSSIYTFAGWNLVGAISSVVRSQGYAVLFNMFGSVVLNAAYGIANQVNSQISFFSDTVIKALRPQITISEGMGNRARMLRLSNIASKIPFILLLMVAMPIMVETDFILKLWLGDVPQYSKEMVQLTLLITLTALMTKGTQIAVEAVGNIKWFQILVGGLHFFAIPLGYVMMRCGIPPYLALTGILLEEITGSIIRVIITNRVTGLNIKGFVAGVLCRNVIMLVLLLGIGTIIVSLIPYGIYRVLFVIVCSVVLCLGFGYLIGLTSSEKSTVKQIISNINNKIRK